MFGRCYVNAVRVGGVAQAVSRTVPFYTPKYTRPMQGGPYKRVLQDKREDLESAGTLNRRTLRERQSVV